MRTTKVGSIAYAAVVLSTGLVASSVIRTEPLGSADSDPGFAGISLSPDGTRVATAGPHKTATLWDASTGRMLQTLSGHQGRVVAAVFSPDGKRLATASWDTTARVWDLATGQSALTLAGHAGAVVGVAFSPDGSRLATVSSDNSARVWNAVSGEQLLTLSGHAGAAYGVTFSPDGSRIATASWDKTAKVWDAASGREVLTLLGHADRVLSVAFSPNGTRLATGGWDQAVRIWDAQTGRKVLTLSGNGGGVLAVAFSPDGKQLATAGGDGSVRLWDSTSGKIRSSLAGHTGPVLGLAFGSDGKSLASAGAGGARIWDPHSGRELLAALSVSIRPASPAAPPPVSDKPQPEDRSKSNGQNTVPASYRIGAGDVLQVSVWREPEASAPQVVVRADGKISLPIVKEVEAVGLTPAELEKMLAEKYRRFLNAPEVSVVAREINSEKVYLVGGVKREGPIRLLAPTTIMQALSEAGGLTDYAKKKSIYVLRTENQKQIRFPFNYDTALKGENMEQNIQLLAGDMIVVPQ